MRILFVNTGPWGTGSFTATACLASSLLDKGHQVNIFFPDAGLHSIDKEAYYNNPDLYTIWEFPITKNGIDLPVFPLIIPDPNPRNPIGITCKSLSESELAFYLAEMHQQLLKTIKQFKPDIIHCHHIWYPASVISNMQLPYVITAHHSDQMGFRYDKRAQKPAIKAAINAGKIIAISQSVREEVLSLYPVNPNQAITIYNGFDSTIFTVKQVKKTALLKQWNIHCDPEAPIITFSGRISHTKGIDLLLQANKLLNPDKNIQIIVLGGGDIEAVFNGLDKDTWSTKNMHFLGQQPPSVLADFHNISLLNVMPSRTEGFGLAALEAMGCALPVVATKCGGPEEFVVGKVIDTESVTQLAEAIMEILNLDDSERIQLKELALLKSREFTASNSAQKHLELYEEILKNPAKKLV